MKKTLTAFALTLLTAATASAGPINFGFETGNLSGWTPVTLGGTTSVVMTFDDGNGPTYGPNEGSYFLVLKTGNAEFDQQVSQPFGMASGETIYGAAAFTTKEATTGTPMYNDSALAQIIQGSTNTIVWSANVTGSGGVGQFGSTPWTTWSFTAPAADSYTLQYTVQNDTDNLFDSYALFDVSDASKVPDGGSALALLGLGMIGLGAIRRKLF